MRCGLLSHCGTEPPSSAIGDGQAPMAPTALTMYSMLAAQPLTNWVTRGAIAPLMQFIVAEQGFSLSEKALLLGAFYP